MNQFLYQILQAADNLWLLKNTHYSDVPRQVKQRFDVFFDLRLNKKVEQTVGMLVIWDAIALIMTSNDITIIWRHGTNALESYPVLNFIMDIP